MTNSSNKIIMSIPARPFLSHLSVPGNVYLTMQLCVMTTHSATYLILAFFLIMSVLEFNTKY